MISSFFISLGAGILGLVIGVLPLSEGLPADIESTLISIASYINVFSYIFPVGSLFSAVTVVLAFELLWWAFWGVMWIWKRIPILGR